MDTEYFEPRIASRKANALTEIQSLPVRAHGFSKYATLQNEIDRSSILQAGSALQQAVNRSISSHPIQKADDMEEAKAKLIHRIRTDASNTLWTGDASNSEVQVSMEGTKAVVGWNVGGNGANSAPNVDRIDRTLNTMLADNQDDYDEILDGGVTEIDYIRAKRNHDGIVHGRSAHAEGIIIAERLKKMLISIQSGEELKHVTLSVFGKKAACKQCGSLISRLNGHPGIQQFFTIQTATDDLFEEVTGDDATHGSQQTKWSNPLHLIATEIPKAEKYVKDNHTPGGQKAGLNYDKLLYFIAGVELEAKRENPA